jgi:hypothetical protein
VNTRAFAPASGPILTRVANAILLRRSFYEAIAADPRTTGPAAGIVCLLALVRESPGMWPVIEGHPAWGLIVVAVIVLALLGWLVYGFFAYALARLIAPAPTDYRRVLRCLGFAEAVTILRLLAFLVHPSLYLPLHLALLGWGFAAVLVAMRAAAPGSTARVVAIALPTFVIQQAVLAAERLLAY